MKPGVQVTVHELETLHLSLATVAGFLVLVAGVVGPWLIAGWWTLKPNKGLRSNAK